MSDDLATLGVYDHEAALDHDTVALLRDVLGELDRRGVDLVTARSAIRRCARGTEWWT